MDSTAHMCHSFILYNLVYWLIFHIPANSTLSMLSLFFGLIPDLDSLYFKLKGDNPSNNNFQHHLYFWSHWPLAYFWTILFTLFSFIIGFYFEYILLLPIGIYSHLISDSITCGDGMMWAKIPWKKNQFAKFYNFFSKKTDGYHGAYWASRYRKTWMYKISIFEGIGIIFYFLLNIIILSFSFANILGIIVLSSSLIFSILPIPKNFHNEPQLGRYADYRTNPDYIAWMKREGYRFDENNKIIKEKKEHKRKKH